MRSGLPRFFCEAFSLILVATWSQTASAELCEMGTLKEACASAKPGRAKLCELAHQSADDDDFDFVHLGGSFYLVAGLNLTLVNIETGGQSSISWRVDPVLAGAKKQADGRCFIADYRALLTHGEFSDRATLVAVRTNPITATPYLLDLGLGALPLPAARSLMCSGRKQKAVRPCSSARKFDKLWHASAQPYTSATVLVKANRAAQSPAGRPNAPESAYEKAGILSILDEKPQDLSVGQYVLMLNNYAFFLTKNRMAELAVELLDKVLRLAPERTPAYLNMADAIDAMVAKRDEATPLSEADLAKLRSASAAYRRQHEERKQARSTTTAAPAR